MASICFYFQVHQPYRLRHYTIFDNDTNYFDEYKNAQVCRKVAGKCYLPTNRLMLDLIRQHEGRFKIAYSITGVILEQFQEYAPEVLASFQELAETGCVEFLAETYYHSLSFLFSPKEFAAQIDAHKKLVRNLFGQTPRIFRNTELVYNNALAEMIERIGGFDAILAEGADHILGWRSPNFVYRPPNTRRLKLLLKNYRLSDDIAFRFSNRGWREWPLRAEKFGQWVNAVNGNGYTVNLFVDYETFGEHQWEDTGIFHFLEKLPQELAKNPGINFATPSEVAQWYEPRDEVSMPSTVTWADTDRDLTAWTGNPMQRSALDAIYALEERVLLANDLKLLEDWRKLQTSDHFYYMCTKWFSDGDVHAYFSPYESPYDAHIAYMNALQDFKLRLEKSRG